MPMSPEARKRASERMKQMHAKKKAEAGQDPQVNPIKPEALTDRGSETQVVTPTEDTVGGEPDLRDLIRQINEIKEQNALLRSALVKSDTPSGAAVTPSGIMGVVELYASDPSLYPNPVERLKNEPKLAQFAFPVNYELEFSVSRVEYQTQHGFYQAEPRFTLQLNLIRRDEETREPTNERVKLRQLIFHEDPAAYVAIAGQHGLEVDRENQKSFMDEMRYLRMRDWLFDAFFQPKATPARNKREDVIGGRIYEVFEASSEDTQNIPFNEMKKFRI